MAIEVFEPGSIARTQSGVEVLVREVQIQSGYSIYYDVSWWKDGVRYTATLPDFELRHILNQPLMEIGFHAFRQT